MIMDDRYAKRGACVAFLVVTFGLFAGETHAQSPLGTTSAKPSFAAAVANLKTSGTALVLVVTSETKPESKIFFRAFSESPWARGHQGWVEILELSAEENASTLQRWKITNAPVVLAYTRGAEAPVCRGLKEAASVNDAVAWLDSLAIGVPAMKPGQLDEGLLRVNYNGFPSPQTPQTSQPMAPAPVAPAPVAPSAPVPMMPTSTPIYPMTMMAAPAPVAAPTSMVQLPTHNVVVQQAQPNVFVQQTAPAPVAMAPMAMAPAAPTAMMAMPAAPVAAPMSYAAAPVAAPMAFAAGPVAVAAMPAASGPAGFTVTNSNIPLSTSRNTNRLRVRPASLRTRIGQWLVDGGRGATIETQNSIELNGSQPQGGGIANLSTSQTQPVAPQTTTQMFAPPQPVAPPVPQQIAPPSPQAPPPPMPSPQYPVKHGHKWLD